MRQVQAHSIENRARYKSTRACCVRHLRSDHLVYRRGSLWITRDTRAPHGIFSPRPLFHPNFKVRFLNQNSVENFAEIARRSCALGTEDTVRRGWSLAGALGLLSPPRMKDRTRNYKMKSKEEGKQIKMAVQHTKEERAKVIEKVRLLQAQKKSRKWPNAPG